MLTTSVFHYTSPDGAFSIFDKKTLWFSDCRYLNDKNENYQPTLDCDRNYFILCASRNSDTVAMWSYYSKNNTYQGYNIGINLEHLAYCIDTDITGSEIKFEHRKVEYSKNPDPHDLFSKHIAFKSEEEYRFVLSVPQNYDWDKDGAPRKLTYKFRVGASGIITPYLEWQFELDEKAKLFTQITLAPMIEEKLAKASFERFLREDVSRNVAITPSSLKMRF